MIISLNGRVLAKHKIVSTFKIIKQLVCAFVLALCLNNAEAQVTKFIAAEAGVNHFFGTEAPDRMGSIFQVGFGLKIGGEDQIQLHTKLNVGNNRYRSRLSESARLVVDQRVFDLSTKMAVPIERDVSFFLGLFGSLAFKGQTFEGYKSYVSVTNRPKRGGNFSNQAQAGISMGTFVGLGRRKRCFFEVQLRQNLIKLFSYDVNWSYSEGGDLIAFNAGAKATSVRLGLGYLLK